MNHKRRRLRTLLFSVLLSLPMLAAAQTLGLRLILVGDSTLAPRSGYGNALCQRLDKIACLNLARGGRSSKSYRAEGLWTSVQTLLREGGQRDLVLIQFGHNDQPGKPGRSTDLHSEFGPNLAAYVREVRAAGAEPLLVTPLTRRSFDGPRLKNDLRPWAQAMLDLGAALEVAVIDLNALSAATVQAMSQAEADTLALAPPLFDRTHLGPKGAALFADQLLQALLARRPELQAALTETRDTSARP